ncbi:MAG: carbohydrate ABC transporter permease [Firmicutes bacterium]|nr:carbohydrate ABC transporter permease [Bacillota bacterium]
MEKGSKIRYFVLTVLALIWIFPLAAMLIFSFAPNSDILLMRLFPTSFTLENYYQVFTTKIRGVSVPRSLANSTIVMVIQTLAILALDIPAAYALGRLKFWGREIIFGIILVTMMMPGHIILISLYALMSSLDLVDTLPGILLPGLPRVVGIFLLRQFFRGLPNELEDAARVDGANEWQTFTRIMLPMAVPAVATLTILTLLYSWNNFLWPLVITNTPESMTAPIAMAYLRSGTNPAQNYSVLLAAAFVTSLPMIILFMVAQKWVVEGISPTSGIK